MPSDVRRSARGAPPATKPSGPAHTSSSSSLSSGRQDRSARTTNVPKSATPHSLSSEEASEHPRRSQRSQPSKPEEEVKTTEHGEEDAGEEEEVTRCICGQQEYPGPPLSEAFIGVEAQSEDTGSLFISCDGCSVWQHGGCVGIVEDAQVPDKYYCEQCRPKQHDLHTDSRGQPYSLYQPVTSKLQRKGSISRSSDKAQQKEREATASRASTDPTTGKRRGTIRSKEYDDEEEQFRKAIEESRRDADPGTGKRGGKRSREDAEDNKRSIKRQRTGSEAQPVDTRNGSSDEESEGEHNGRSKKARAEAVQTQRQAEVREKEKERDRARADAAGRRQERAGRRRVEDELVEDTPRATTSAKTSAPPSSQPASPPVHLVPEKLSHKKGAGKKTKKLGNNQYTKLREQGGVPSSPHSKKRQLASHGTVSSGDEQLPNGETNTSNSTNKNSPDHTSGGPVSKGPGRFGKNKKNGLNGNGAKGANGDGNGGERTMASMNRTLEAMSRSIAAAQLELAGSGVGGAVREPGGGGGDRPFEELSAMEMADVVSRGIYEWQTRWAHMV